MQRCEFDSVVVGPAERGLAPGRVWIVLRLAGADIAARGDASMGPSAEGERWFGARLPAPGTSGPPLLLPVGRTGPCLGSSSPGLRRRGLALKIGCIRISSCRRRSNTEHVTATTAQFSPVVDIQRSFRSEGGEPNGTSAVRVRSGRADRGLFKSPADSSSRVPDRPSRPLTWSLRMPCRLKCPSVRVTGQTVWGTALRARPPRKAPWAVNDIFPIRRQPGAPVLKASGDASGG
jgi:hypothetical protein